MLLEDIEKKEDKKKNKDMEMEITWGLGIKDKAEELVKKKMTEGNSIIDITVGHVIIFCSCNKFIDAPVTHCINRYTFLR